MKPRLASKEKDGWLSPGIGFSEDSDFCFNGGGFLRGFYGNR